MIKKKYPDGFINEIICGNCLNVMDEMPNECIDLIITSPPYNIGINYQDEYTDAQSREEYFSFLFRVLSQSKRLIKKDGLMCFVIGNQSASGLPHHFYNLLIELKFHIIREIYWFKGLCYIPGEWIFVTSLSSSYNKYYQRNDAYYSNNQFPFLWDMRYLSHETQEIMNHPALFTIKIPSKLMEINTIENDIILDPFMGCGTTARAAKNLKRNFIGIEINPGYCKIAEERLSQGVL